jgi:hypothetical protein
MAENVDMVMESIPSSRITGRSFVSGRLGPNNTEISWTKN